MMPLSEKLMERLVTPTDVKPKLLKECEKLLQETVVSTFRATPTYYSFGGMPYVAKKTFTNREVEVIPSIEDVIAVYCQKIGVSVDFIKTRNRNRKYTDPRQTIMHFLEAQKEYLHIYLVDISNFFSMNHATCLNSKRVVNNRLLTDKKFQKQYKEIEEHLKNRFNIG